ncbi:MAG: transcriptional regulator [Spirochaetales bacterium]|nr:transcriptional regulator [Spirochaetales bacterium]
MNQDIAKLAQVDFDRARLKEIFGKISFLISDDTNEPLSLEDIKSILKPKSSTYKGVKPVKVSKIVGSEGRYKDFNRMFLPKHTHLRDRWESVDKAHHTAAILPPVNLYEIGGLYFVRDGNHRVSVAKLQKVEFIDAEVTALDSELKLNPEMTRNDIKQAVIEFEKQQFYEETELLKFRPESQFDFTAIGRYDEIIRHILGHKYYINQNYKYELSFETAMLSWYDNVFIPIINIIEKEEILSRFPGRTAADLYVWIVKWWHELKGRYGDDYPIEQVVLDYSEKYGKGGLRIIGEFFKKLLVKIFKD